jgi:predicted metalloprotease
LAQAYVLAHEIAITYGTTGTLSLPFTGANEQSVRVELQADYTPAYGDTGPPSRGSSGGRVGLDQATSRGAERGGGHWRRSLQQRSQGRVVPESLRKLAPPNECHGSSAAWEAAIRACDTFGDASVIAPHAEALESQLRSQSQ